MLRSSTDAAATSESVKTLDDQHPYHPNPAFNRHETSRQILNENNVKRLRNWNRKDMSHRLLLSRFRYLLNNL